MEKKNQESSGKKNSAKKKWADNVTIAENPNRNGIELRFNAEPSHELQSKLRAMGFRPSKSQRMWYGDNSESNKTFASEIESELPTSSEGPDLFLSPSFEALKTNIEQRDFSYILMTLKDGEIKSYIVFEPSKPKAEVIAGQFAKQEFGENFVALAAMPRTHLREARVLFDEGKIIFPNGQKVPTRRESSIKGSLAETETSRKEGDKIPVREILLTTKEEDQHPLYKEGKAYSAWSGADLFVKGLIGKFSDVYYKAIWQDGETLEGSVDLEPKDFYQGKEEILSSHVQYFLGRLSKEKPNILYSTKAIEKAKKLLAGYELKHVPVYTPKQPVTTLKKFDAFAVLKQFHDWLKKDGKGYEKVEQASKEEFDAWLEETEPDMSGENPERVWNHHLALVKAANKLHNKIHGVPQMQPYSSIYKKLMQVIPDLIKHIQEGKYHGKSVKDPKGGLMDLNYDYLGKDKNGNYIIALSHYFEQNGDLVADPDMQIRILPDLEAAEAMTFQDQFGYQEVYQEKDGKELVDLKRKKELNQFLNQWLTNIIQQGHKIDLAKEESETADETLTNPESSQTVKPEFARLHTPEEEKEIIEQFIAQGFKRPFSAQEAFDKNLPVIDLAFRYVESMEYFRDHIENPRKERIQKFRNQLKELKGEKGVFEKKESLKNAITQLEAEMNKAEQLVQDETLIFNDDLFEIILDKAKQKGYSPEGESEISSFRDYVTTNVLDNRAIENYHKEPVNKVVDELIDEYFNKEESPIYTGIKDKAFYESLSNALKAKSNAIKSYVVNNLKGSRNEAERQERFKEADELFGYSLKPDSEMDKLIAEGKIPQEILDEITGTENNTSLPQQAIAEDLKSGDTFLPNVLVPAGAKEPFLANNFSIYDMKAIIKNNFPHLLKINEKNLSKASALEMFELVQMAHPNDYGIDVGRSAMLNEWEKRGKEMFEELGYPTDTIYPYINIYLGYESIEPLGEILSDNNKEGNEWWAVAEHCRPIADTQKGLEIIEQLIEKQKRERQTLVNSKTGKPKLEYKKLAGDIAHTIENLNDSKEVLQHYLDNPPEKITAIVKTQKDPLANEQGVYTEKTAGDNLEEIEIPIPKGAQYEASIAIVKISNGDYTFGLDASKKFGDHDSLMFAPSVSGQTYSTKEEALKYAVKHLELKLEVLLTAKDTILGNEDKKKKQLNMALDAIKKFAEENNISLENNPAVSGKISIKEIHLTTRDEKGKADYSNAIVVKNWSDANDVLIKQQWKKNPTVYFKVVWADGETFERSLDEGNAGLYSGKRFPLSDFIYQYNLTISKMKLLKGSSITEADVKKAKKLIEGYIFSDPTETNVSEGIIKGLEDTYWTKEDNKYPVNKAVINGMEFNQSRLRKAIEDKLEKLPLDTLQDIAEELSEKFKERKPLGTYEKGYVTVGKSGDKRKASLIAIYVDNMIVDNDMTDKYDYPVMTFLVDLLFGDSQKLVDLPQYVEKQAPSKMKKQSQHELNKEIEAFIEKKDKEGSSFNEEEKNYIRQYTGSGGLIKEGAAGRGVLYEYYTPDVVVQKMWGMAFKYGYDGGSVLEPSVGTGNFLKYAPKDAIVFGFETNHYSARIAQILYPNAHIHEKSFESLFFAGNIHLKDDFDHPRYSLVIGNPPYGDFTGKYAGMGEKQWTGATEYDQYFILRGLDLLKKGGILVFVVPSSFLAYNVKSAKVKEKIASKVDFMDAYRLPIRTFDTTDIGTDILLLRKNK